MESINKFKILTIIVICTFLFVIAAIYSNTKDATSDKTRLKKETANENMANTRTAGNSETSQNNQNVHELTSRIEFLNRRIDELEQRIRDDNLSNSLNCRIIGSLANNEIELLSEEAAIQEARVNNRDIVITCSF